MLKRKFMNILNDWKQDKRGKCLLVSGARQVGKTYLIDHFGESYENYIKLDFRRDPSMADIFKSGYSVDMMTASISLYVPGARFVPGKTLILLDEIQDCPQARSSLKYWALDGRYDVIATGSLLGVHLNGESVPVGYEKQVVMHALDFEEFLWAIGIDETTLSVLKPYFSNGQQIPAAFHEKMLEYLRLYMAIGGMPEAVNAWLKDHSFQSVDEQQNIILNGYEDDIAKYAETDSVKIRAQACWKSVPRQLLKENHKFQYKLVKHGATSTYFMNSFDWLEKAGLVTRCYHVKEPAFPLNGYCDESNYRVYMNDIGLLTASYGFQTKAAVIQNDLLGSLKGALYENLIADMLIKKDIPLYYYRNEKGTIEMEFLVERDHAVIPVEVKAGNTRAASLNHLLELPAVPYGFKFISGNAGKNGKIITLPLYMAMFL